MFFEKPGTADRQDRFCPYFRLLTDFIPSIYGGI
jgi:hypothetical protein